MGSYIGPCVVWPDVVFLFSSFWLAPTAIIGSLLVELNVYLFCLWFFHCGNRNKKIHFLTKEITAVLSPLSQCCRSPEPSLYGARNTDEIVRVSKKSSVSKYCNVLCIVCFIKHKLDVISVSNLMFINVKITHRYLYTHKLSTHRHPKKY